MGCRFPIQKSGWLALEKNDFSQAAKIFRTEGGMNNALSYFGLGRAFIGLEDYPAAERALRVAEFMGGDPLIVNEAFVLLYERMNDPAKLKQAKIDLDELKELTPIFGPGKLGDSGYAWYIYHRESIPLGLLPGASMQGSIE